MNDSSNPIQGVTDEQIRTALTRLRDAKPLFSTVDVIRAVLDFYHRTSVHRAVRRQTRSSANAL